MVEESHLEARQRGRRADAPSSWIHRLQRLFQRLPVQCAIQPFQKIVRRRGAHQAVQKSKLRIGRRLHISRTLDSKIKFQNFCRDTKMYDHKLPDGMIVEARQYRNDMLEHFIEFIDVEWLHELRAQLS